VRGRLKYVENVPKQIRDLLRAKTEGGRFRLAEVDPDSTPGLKSSWHEKKDLAKPRSSRSASTSLMRSSATGR
jgi:hypothetical protein